MRTHLRKPNSVTKELWQTSQDDEKLRMWLAADATRVWPPTKCPSDEWARADFSGKVALYYTHYQSEPKPERQAPRGRKRGTVRESPNPTKTKRKVRCSLVFAWCATSAISSS